MLPTFWRVLDDLGVWRHLEYILGMRTSIDVREIMPECVLNVN